MRFTKRGSIRFISHLALMKAFERTLRRAALPLRMTQGFNRRPRLSFPLPLGVGTEGLDEVMEFELNGWTSPAEVKERVQAALPPGIEMIRVRTTPPNVTARVAEATCVATPRDPDQPEARVSEADLLSLLDRNDIPVRRMRKGKIKTVNIRPFILDLRRENGAIVMRLRISDAGTTRPEEILAAMGLPSERLHELFFLERTQVVLAPHTHAQSALNVP